MIDDSDGDAEATRATRPGPIDDRPWPTTLRGHVVDPGPPTRVYGFDVAADLARHYGWSDVVLTTLRGEAPDENESRAFGHAMTLLLPVAATEAPVHAAILARLIGSDSSGVASTGAIVLAEQARDLVAAVRDELPGLLGGSSAGSPDEAVASKPSLEASVVELLGDDLTRLEYPNHRLDSASSVTAAALAVLYACGLRHVWQLETALMLARLACVTAEARRHQPGRFGEYPMDRPAYRYRDPSEDSDR